MKKLLIVIISVLIFMPVTAFAINITTETELVSILTTQDKKITIELLEDIYISNPITISGDVSIIGNGNKITYKESYSGKIFEVTGNLELNNVILDGKNEWSWKNASDKNNPEITGTSSTLNIPGNILSATPINVTGTLSLTNKTKVQNYYIDLNDCDKISIISATNAKRILIDNSTFENIYGMLINSKSTPIELNNNTNITNNYGNGNKGGLFVISGGTITLNNANITNNLGCARSGTLFGIINSANMILNDGKIENNIAKYYGNTSTGSMICLESGGGFTMNGGSISNNIGTLASAISSRWTKSPEDNGIFLNRETIVNNRTTKDTWLYATIYLRSDATIGKGMNFEGEIVVNSSNATLINEGLITGPVVVNDSTAKLINNGIIMGSINLQAGTAINNGTVKNARDGEQSIVNNGNITNNYYKELADETGKVRITLIGNGGKITDNNYTKYDLKIDENSLISVKNDLPQVSKEYQTFIDWYIDENLTMKFDESIPLTKNITLYAKFERKTFKITWNTGTEKIEKVIYAGEKIIIPDEIKKEGFILTGWENYETDMLMPEKDMEFRAIWVKKTVDNPETGITDNMLVSPIVILVAIMIIIFLKKKVLYNYNFSGKL